MSAVTELTRELVAIPSHEDETAAGDRIEAWLREHTDATVERDDAPNGGNVVARKGAGGPSLALVGHHDVVPPDESQVASDGSFVVEERDGRLYGRGTADMKGADAAMMLAFRDADPDAELIFASFVGEERGSVGCKHAVEHGFAPDYAVVGEGSTNYSGPDVTDVAVAHKGRRGSTIVARGAASHASEPEAGENAIYRACDAVDLLRDLEFPSVEVAGQRIQGSVVVTEIEGGTAGNVVPERCEFTVDERTVPGERADVGRVEAVEGVEWIVDRDSPPMQCGDPDFVDAVFQAAIDVQDNAPEQVVKPHATDAGHLSQNGVETIVCGPSEPGQAHTADESASIAVLERCERLYRSVATEWPRPDR
jgi:acetylornithine deacetylase